MSKICSKCNKTVYPLEELKCLDKIWHKTCFKCWECGMSLNMKNYKGFDKKPYCSAHYPHMKATSVAETPELQRIAQNTKIQSQIKYHEDFEKNIKGSKIQVTDDPETQRVKQANQLVSQVEYKNRDKTGEKLEERRQSLTSSMTSATPGERWMPGATRDVVKPSPYSERATSHSTTYTAEGKVEGVARVSRIGSIADYDPVNENYGSLASGYRPTSTTSRISQSQEWEEVIPMSPQTKSGRSSASSAVSTSGIGSSSDPDQHNPSTAAAHHTDDVFPSRNSEPSSNTTNDTTNDTHSDRHSATHSMAHSDIHGSAHEATHSDTTEREVVIEEETPQYKQHDEKEDDQAEVVIAPHHQPGEEGKQEPQQDHSDKEDSDEPGESLGTATFLTMYDYEAQDDDEVSFVENDKVVNVRSVSDGWMFGTVERTGKRGMFPANYAEEIK